jgi:type II secretory pathway pseudopilin PulG
LRGAWTLIELVFVVGVSGILMSMAAAVAQPVLSARGQVHEALRQSATLAQLGRQLRQDAHESLRVVADDAVAGQRVRLELPGDKLVEYALDEGSLVRLAREQDKLQQRERFELRGRRFTEVAIARDQPQIVRVELQAKPVGDVDSPPRTFGIEAAIGRRLTETQP